MLLRLSVSFPLRPLLILLSIVLINEMCTMVVNFVNRKC